VEVLEARFYTEVSYWLSLGVSIERSRRQSNKEYREGEGMETRSSRFKSSKPAVYKAIGWSAEAEFATATATVATYLRRREGNAKDTLRRTSSRARKRALVTAASIGSRGLGCKEKVWSMISWRVGWRPDLYRDLSPLSLASSC
jgi:hypothetical protein